MFTPSRDGVNINFLAERVTANTRDDSVIPYSRIASAIAVNRPYLKTIIC